MNILLFNFFVTLFLSLVIRNTPPQTQIFMSRKRWFVILTSVLYIVILSTPVLESVTDISLYNEYFQRLSTYSLKEVLLGLTGFEPGYAFLNFAVLNVTDNFTVLLFVYAVLIIFLYQNTFYKYSPYISISVLMFLLTFFNQHIFLIRQGISVAVCCYSIRFIIERKLWYFIIASIIAFSFHNSSMVFFPLYFLYEIKQRSKSSFVFVALLLMMFVFFHDIIRFVGANFERFEHYLENKELTSVTNMLIALMITIFYWGALGKKVLEDGINRLVFYMLIITVVTYGISLGFTSALVRALMCYRISYLFAIPITIKYIKDRQARQLYEFGVLLCFFLLTYVIGSGIHEFENYRLIFM